MVKRICPNCGLSLPFTSQAHDRCPKCYAPLVIKVIVVKPKRRP